MTVFNYLLEATLTGSVLILLTVAVRGLLRHQLGSRLIYALWLPVALRLLLPISLPNPLMDTLRPALSVDLGARPMADQVRQRLIDAGYNASAVLPGSGGESIAYLAQSTRGGRAGRWFLLGWLVLAVLVTAWLCYRGMRLERTVRRNRVRRLNAEEEALYRGLCERYGVRRPIPVYYVDRLANGCLVGVARPFIGVPLNLPPEHLALQLSHQLCHYRVHDPLWGVARALCCGAHWFNPLVWMAAWLSYHDSEMACDDRVTARLHDMDRLAYANVIVSAGERECGAESLSAGASFTGRHLRRRVTAVIRCVRGSRVGIALCSLCAAAALVLSFATGESEPLPTIESVPAVAWTASAEPIAADMDAIAAARRFLESPFIGENTTLYGFTAYATEDGGWRVEARKNREDSALTLLFSADGCLTGYDGLSLLGEIAFDDSSYTHRKLTQSARAYMDAFIAADVPEMEYDGCFALADMRSGQTRLLFGELQNGKESVADFAVQVEPTARVVMVRRISR